MEDPKYGKIHEKGENGNVWIDKENRTGYVLFPFWTEVDCEICSIIICDLRKK